MAKTAIPKGGAMRFALDIWETLDRVCAQKGMTTSDRRVAAEAIIRCYADSWASGDCPGGQPQPPSDAPAAPPVINVLDAL